MKKVIWSNMNLDIKDWEDYFESEFDYELTENQKYNEMIDLNNQYIDDERDNLNIQLNNPIIAIADLGLWNGRKQGYKIIESGNIKDILYSDADYVEWYSDGYNIKSVQVHHDGTNYIEYRELKDNVNIDKFTDMIYEGKEITRSLLNRYTNSIEKHVRNVYGW